MNKILVILGICCLIVACSNVKKPPLSETQMVNGKSIIIPPEFDVIPTMPQKGEVKADKGAESVKKETIKKEAKKEKDKK